MRANMAQNILYRNDSVHDRWSGRHQPFRIVKPRVSMPCSFGYRKGLIVVVGNHRRVDIQ
jgi:hypothetical protein